MIPGFGPAELMILLFVVLLLFGAKRIPQLARSLGSGAREFRKGISDKDEGREEAHDGKREGELPAAEKEVGLEAGEANARAPERAGQQQGL